MKLTGLQAFVAVVECGSIHAGARKLGISQPALSKTLRALEEELGVELVTRTSRGTVTTAYGQTFLIRAERVVREIERAQEEVEQLKGNIHDKLSVSVSPVSSFGIFPTAVEKFRLECPDIELHLIESQQHEIAELVRSNLAELAVTPLNIPLDGHEFRKDTIAEVTVVPVVRRDHPLANETRLSNLQSAQWLQVGPGGAVTTFREQAFESQGLPVPKASITCQTISTATAFVLGSDVIAMLPLPLLELPHLAGQFKVLNLDIDRMVNTIGVVYRADSALTPAAQILATHLKRAGAGEK
ncbi:MAG: LysR family transcriptional regulator [Burkholderiaceae bacterium]